jgi:hypothetical protein
MLRQLLEAVEVAKEVKLNKGEKVAQREKVVATTE